MEAVFPGFYDAARVGELYLERVAEVDAAAQRVLASGVIQPASQDKFRVAAFGIDVQGAFCLPGASLFVPGAVEDTRRVVEWLYRNLGQITDLFFSLDTHHVYQVFHPAFWVDSQGKHPAPFTPVFCEDVVSGRWTPLRHRALMIEYTRKLEATGKYVLTIWPYHALLGGASHALVPAMMEVAMFHTLTRQTQAHFEVKGTHDLTENYSVMSPEVTELGGERVGEFNVPLFNKLMSYDRIYVFGQASSHCVLSTLSDLLRYCQQTDPRLVEKIYILEDGMSPVTPPPLDPLPPSLNFPAIADQALAEFARVGMKRVKSTDILEVPRG